MRYLLLATTIFSVFFFTMACRGKFDVGTTEKEDPPAAVPSAQPSVDSGEVAVKLTSDDCIDPDLSKLASDQQLMLCDGTIASGTYEPEDSADLSNLVASNVKSGVVIAGVTGTLVPSPADCSNDGEEGCVTNESFKAAEMANFTSTSIVTGTTIAGVAGANGGNPSCGSDGDSSCLVDGATYKAAAISGLAAKVVSGQTVAGVSGSADAKLADCNSDGDTLCSVDDGTNYKAAASGVLVAGNIKRGVQIGGATGNYPSSSSPLPRYSDDGSTTNTTGSDETDLTSFSSQLTSVGTFEFWDSAGVRRTGSGDVDIVNANVKDGVDFENLSVNGSYAGGGSDCTSDGEEGCTTTSRYKAMDTDASVISAWDIRSGKTAGGIAGSLVFYKNMADTTTFNRTTGTASDAGLDVYDTIDDNNGSFPTENPGSWPQATGANWTVDDDCVTTDCTMKDEITGLYWYQDDATTRTWEDAITYCDGLSGKGSGSWGDWRLPTQKELMQAYTDGIWSQKDAAKLNLTPSNYYWSSSTISHITSNAWNVYLTNGYTRNFAKTISRRVVCVRGS